MEEGLNALKGIGKVASTVLVGCAVVLALALVGVRLVGFEVYTVLSGSMEPAYKTGSVIWVDRCEPEDVEVGDAITFVLNEDLDVATHRVIEVDAENSHFYTQGDANDAPDGSPVHFENLIGVPVFTVPHLGYLVSYVQSPPGCYVALIVAAPAEMTQHFFVFVLACVIGFYVITGVSHTLHTPLMSVTNAISGIIIVGALLQVAATGDIAVLVMATIAIAIAAINIFGGFLVTHRMLKMFERSSE